MISEGCRGTGIGVHPVIAELLVCSPASYVLVIVSLDKLLHCPACWWWSEGPVSQLHRSLTSVRLPQGIFGYSVAT